MSEIEHSSIDGVTGWSDYTCSLHSGSRDDQDSMSSQDILIYHYDPNEGSVCVVTSEFLSNNLLNLK